MGSEEVRVKGDDDVVEELAVTIVWLVWVTVGVIVMVVALPTSELLGVELVGGSWARAWSKHPTWTPAVVFIGMAKHDKPVSQGLISKLPALEH